MAKAKIVTSVLEDMDLRAARQLRDETAEAFRRHKGGCFECERAVRRRRPADLCPTGGGLRTASLEASAAWKAEQEDAQAPNPNQDSLF